MRESAKYTLNEPPASSSLELQLVPLDFVIEWQRCGLLADYLAAHLAHAFDNRDGVRNALSTVLNELIENVVKFSADKTYPARVSVSLRENTIVIETSSRSGARHGEVLVSTLRELAQQPAEQLFLARLSATGGGSESGLGLLVLQKDYGVRFDARVEQAEGALVDVWLTATLRADILEER